ncbi:MAG: glycosyltransferase family 2 protein, partial [Pseudomonadota bacterium]
MATTPESLAISAVVPVKNEAENILPLVTEIDAALRETGAEYEIIYVDDGSDDVTPQKLKETQVTFPALRIITHSNSCGQSRAVATGVRYARGRMIVTLDGDGQNVPADIPAMWGKLEGAEDLMVAGRRMKRRDVWIKRVSSRWANRIRARLLKDDTPDTGCGLKLFP